MQSLKPLSDKERTYLRRLLRQGYLFFAGIMVLTILSAMVEAFGHLLDLAPGYILAGGTALAVFVTWLINKGYWLDLANGVKEVRIGQVRRKESRHSHEAGSSVAMWNEMKEYEYFALIVGEYRYQVTKEVWQLVEEGDEVELHFGPRSGERLGIHRHDTAGDN